MKRSTGNLLTVVFSLLVFAAGAIFAFYLLPVITDDREESIQTFSTTINTPQEIVENPKNMISCLEFFPQSYSNRKLVDSSELNEMDLQNMKLFLTSLGNQANLLFNVRIDSVILERYIQIWQYHSNSSSDDARTDDIYYIDLLFLDARSVQWRITAGGYSDEIFYLSCLEQDKEPSTPVFPTQISSPAPSIPLRSWIVCPPLSGPGWCPPICWDLSFMEKMTIKRCKSPFSLMERQMCIGRFIWSPTENICSPPIPKRIQPRFVIAI